MSDKVSGRKKVVIAKNSREKIYSSSDRPAYKSSAEISTRYKGNKKSSVYKSSDECFEYSCDLCSSAGDHMEAEGFCTDCGEYLCGTCFRSHSRGKATKYHKLLNKNNMPRKHVQTCDPCKSAGDEIEAVGYCDDCEEYLCSSCFRSHSRGKATKHHNLKNNMPEESVSAIASSVAKIDINKEGARYQKSKEGYSYVRDISVKAAGDTQKCYIVAMTLVSNNEIVLADKNNASLKLVDVERNVIKDTLDLESVPFDLTTISKDEVAVSLPQIYVIQIVTISGNLSVQRNIKLIGHCGSIEYLNGKLYGSFPDPVYFQIIQLSGAVYKTIKPDAEVRKHCKTPRYIAVSPNESAIYVSDWETNKVMCVDMDGYMICMYQGELENPLDIVITPFGSIYLCNRDRHAIYKMTPDLSEATVILGPRDGVVAPQSMCFNIEKKHLYISSASDRAETCDYIKVFKWR